MLQPSEILRLMAEDNASERKRLARQGARYYRGEHDIRNYQIYYYDGDGNLVADKFKSNIRISHPFFTELVDQQVQYMLSGGGGMVRSDNPVLQRELERYFDEDFYAELYELLQGCIVKGFEYLYAMTDREGRTRFACADSLGIVEVREKDTDEDCICLLYWYVDRVDRGQRRICRVQVWDREEVAFFVQEREGELVPDLCVPGEQGMVNHRPHTIYTDPQGQRYGRGFGRIPFWRLDNGREQASNLRPIKGLIDDYDLMACSLSNNLQDFTDAIYVVSGFQGGNLDELVQNLRAKKHIGVDTGGNVDIRTVEIPYEARVAKLDLDEKNIYRFGMGFHAEQKGDGNITNVVIRSRYTLLDLKCNKLELRLRQLLRQLLAVVLPEINGRLGTDFRQEEVYFDLTRHTITNAADNAEIAKLEAERHQIEVATLVQLQALAPEGGSV